MTPEIQLPQPANRAHIDVTVTASQSLAESTSNSEVTRAYQSDAPPSGKRRISATPETSNRVSTSDLPQRLQTVLLIEADPKRLQWLTDVLAGDYQVVSAHVATEASSILQRQPVDFVVANAKSCNGELLSDLAAHQLSRATAFLADSTEVERLINEYSSRHVFSVLNDRISHDDLLQFVHSVLSPRIAVRYAMCGVEVQLKLGPRKRIKCGLLDLSNRGIAMLMSADQGLLLPDTIVTSLRLIRGTRVLFDGCAAVVRHVELLRNPEMLRDASLAYKVGLEFQGARATKSTESEKLVEQPIRVLAIIRDGLRNSHLSVSPVDLVRHAKAGPLQAIDRAGGVIRIGGAPPQGLTIGDVVRANFEHTGTNYSFFSSIVQTNTNDDTSYEIKVPRALRAIRQRRSPRIKPPESQSIIVEVESPFDDSFIERPVLNITASGLAFPISEKTDLYPVGTRIRRLLLRFPNQPGIAVSGMVRTLRPTHGAEHSGQAVCGVEFDKLDATECARLAGAITQCNQPSLRDGTGTPFRKLWDFFLKTGFLYPEKLHSIDVPAVEETLSRLLAEPNEVLKTSLIVRDGEIAGHSSGFLTYSRTWTLQHLAAMPTGKSQLTYGRLMNLAVFNYLDQIPSIEWVRVWYRPNNRWPMRVFGTFAKQIADPTLSNQVTLNYFVGRSDAPASEKGNVLVRQAELSDLRRIEAYFVAQAPLLVRTDDLSTGTLPLTSVAKAYGALGLERRREILVAEQAGAFAGFALLEISSPGLNFSELTNTFRVFAPNVDVSVHGALIAAARRRYHDVGRANCVALAADEQIPVFKAAGFELRKQYNCWTWHRSLYQRYCRHIQQLQRST